jgi:uncharacterized protein (DUF433 family)
MAVDWKKHIVSDPEILRGRPRLKGTRIPVGVVLGYLAAGKTAEQIVAEFPDLTPQNKIDLVPRISNTHPTKNHVGLIG